MKTLSELDALRRTQHVETLPQHLSHVIRVLRMREHAHGNPKRVLYVSFRGEALSVALFLDRGFPVTAGVGRGFGLG